MSPGRIDANRRERKKLPGNCLRASCRLFLTFVVLVSFSGLTLSWEEAQARSRKLQTMTPEKFSAFVLEIGEKEFPELKLRGTDSPFTLKWKEDGQISLDNLYKHVKGIHVRERATEEVRNFLQAMKVFPPIDQELKTWEDAKVRIRPQIFPRAYLDQKEFAQKMVFKPLAFSNQLMEGYVVDSKRAFRYVMKSDLKKWNVSQEIIKDTAYENLVQASTGTKLEAIRARGSKTQGRYLTIDINDGYAAARLLLPAVRNKIESQLGKPCFVAIPNRDYLIAWSYDSDTDQLKQFENKVVRKFHFKDHPLSPEIYAIVNSMVEKKDSVETNQDNAQAPEKASKK